MTWNVLVDEYIITLDEFDFVVLRMAVELTMRVSLDKATGTSKLESRGFRLIGPGLEGIGELLSDAQT